MSTARSIVSDLGAGAVAVRLGVGASAVSNNVVIGSFPASWFVPLFLMGLEQGVSVPVSLFRWRSVDAHSLQDCEVRFHVSSAADGS
ncbi:hypothetical protein [Cohaesibacter haloalkalitolerans]|uniref:hypothetical protein n=1 Tax=Cohaesibacter haloalkalitolerans TaxID=1162980 RepID=UPI000E64D8F0|nr:hypothetical protein [Cohaesibacter haloalkalitolerans]